MKAKVFYHPIDGSAPLSISWVSGPKEDAIEAKDGNGVGFFSHSGEILGVIFDNVKESKDKQTLMFKNFIVQLTVANGEVRFTIENLLRPKSKKAS